MFKWRDFNPQSVFRATWTDGVEQLLGNYVSPNFVIDQPADNQLRVAASTNVDARALTIQGKPRWIEASITVTPSGAAGIQTLWAVSTADAFSTQPGPPSFEQDDTNHAFTLKAGGTPSGTGGEAISRAIALYYWDGTSKIVALYPLVGQASVGDTQVIDAPGSETVPGAPYAAILSCSVPVLKAGSLFKAEWQFGWLVQGVNALGGVQLWIGGAQVTSGFSTGSMQFGQQNAATASVISEGTVSGRYYWRPAATGVTTVEIRAATIYGGLVMIRASRRLAVTLQA